VAPNQERNLTPLIVVLSIVINAVIAVLFFMPKAGGMDHLDLTFLPMLNAILNSFTFVFLCAALYFIKKKQIRIHRNFIFAAFSSTFLFLLSYLTYHSMAESTSYGGEGPLRYIYFFILLTHIVLAAAIVPLALVTLIRGLRNNVAKHRKIARWTMPIWMYVSLTGVVVYLMISPYYGQ
jgi:putative membrane protein